MKAASHRPEPPPYRIRAMTAADAQRDREFIAHLSEKSRYQRFMHAMREPPPALLRSLLALDGHRQAAFVATVGDGAAETIVGVARYAAESDTECEFAIAVADEWQCRGIGSALMRHLFEQAKREGFRVVYGNILADNAPMIELARYLGLEVGAHDPAQSTLRAARRFD